jgi:hypothetical protein
MFQNLVTYPIESPLLKWESKLVLRDQDHEARLYLRLRLTGTSFPIFNSIPFVQVGNVKARFVDIADDGLSVKAYFDTALPNESAIEFGYDDQVLLRFPNAYHSRYVTRLDNSRLPKNLQYQDVFFKYRDQ